MAVLHKVSKTLLMAQTLPVCQPSTYPEREIGCLPDTHPAPTPNRSLSAVAARPSSPPGLLTLHKLKLGFYKDPRGCWMGRPPDHLCPRQSAATCKEQASPGVSQGHPIPPSLIRAAAGTRLRDQQAPGSWLLAPPLAPAQLARTPRSTPLLALPVMPQPHCPRPTPSPSAGPATSPKKGQRQVRDETGPHVRVTLLTCGTSCPPQGALPSLQVTARHGV